MKKTIILKITISIGLLLINLLPEIDKELYVQSTGNIKQFDTIFILIAIFGLFKSWKNLKEILLIPVLITLVMSIITIITGNLLNENNDIRLGWIINIIISLIVILAIVRLRKFEK